MIKSQLYHLISYIDTGFGRQASPIKGNQYNAIENELLPSSDVMRLADLDTSISIYILSPNDVIKEIIRDKHILFLYIEKQK